MPITDETLGTSTCVIRSLKARGEIVGYLIVKRFQRFRGNVTRFSRAPGQAPGALAAMLVGYTDSTQFWRENHANPSFIYYYISGTYD
jgi:hypothetical protein